MCRCAHGFCPSSPARQTDIREPLTAQPRGVCDEPSQKTPLRAAESRVQAASRHLEKSHPPSLIWADTMGQELPQPLGGVPKNVQPLRVSPSTPRTSGQCWWQPEWAAWWWGHSGLCACLRRATPWHVFGLPVRGHGGRTPAYLSAAERPLPVK